ncbi:unnamed protein product [Notodromas monacha]|uniref:PPM-type phosphatase domain-containing protein n=1 Tax=Notodromas monacha TaxID=399045 RepID=A0A7R9GF29_9CRUS|nr:unnamed protein product [Notodromas monacha]CAG0918907.1 unnamed protein product [Notodromas monacha]
MGSFLDKPKTEKHSEAGDGNGMRFGLSSMQGWRIEMEDAHAAVVSLPNLSQWSYFAVFDGHAGAGVSAYCAANLLDSIIKTDAFQRGASGNNKVDVTAGIRTGFLNLDERMKTSVPQIVSGEDKSGSTAVCTLISDSHLYISNCGDSRAVLARGGEVALATTDHKPSNPLERERIINAGGSVMIQRVNGSLAVSRALGDFDFKNVEGRGPTEQLVSPEPDVYVLDRSENDEFLILACDGIWDVISSRDLCDYIRSRLRISDKLDHVCNEIVDTCLNIGSRDNMSLVLVTFAAAPKVSPEAQEKERKLDELLKKKVKDILEADPTVDVTLVFDVLSTDDIISDLPPGAQLHAKRNVIEKTFLELKPPPEENEEQQQGQRPQTPPGPPRDGSPPPPPSPTK